VCKVMRERRKKRGQDWRGGGELVSSTGKPSAKPKLFRGSNRLGPPIKMGKARTKNHWCKWRKLRGCGVGDESEGEQAGMSYRRERSAQEVKRNARGLWRRAERKKKKGLFGRFGLSRCGKPMGIHGKSRRPFRPIYVTKREKSKKTGS